MYEECSAMSFFMNNREITLHTVLKQTSRMQYSGYKNLLARRLGEFDALLGGWYMAPPWELPMLPLLQGVETLGGVPTLNFTGTKKHFIKKASNE